MNGEKDVLVTALNKFHYCIYKTCQHQKRILSGLSLKLGLNGVRRTTTSFHEGKGKGL